MTKQPRSQTALLDKVLAGVPDDIATRLSTYAPGSLSADVWASCRTEVLTLVVATEPVSVTDARYTACALCVFVEWARREIGRVELRAAVTDCNVDRWFFAATTDRSKGVRQNYRARLRRVVRVLAGDPARTKRHPRGVAPIGYEGDELAVLVTAAEHSPDLAFALACAFADGTTVKQRLLPSVADPGAAEVFCRSFGLPSGWLDSASVCEPVSERTWRRARRAACAVGVDLTADRLHTTWLVWALDCTTPLRLLASSIGLTRADMEHAYPHLPLPTANTYRRYLRGE